MPKKRRKRRKKPEVTESALKENIQGFPGGLSVDLSQKTGSGRTLREDLSMHIEETLDQELKNREERLENLDKWQKQYSGWREAKNSPFYRSANTAVPMTPSLVDTVYVRLEDTLYGREKIVLIKPIIPEASDLAFKIEEGLEWYLRNMLDFKAKMVSPLLSTVKYGEAYVMVDWEEKKRTVYRYATEEEEGDEDIGMYGLNDTTDKAVKLVRSLYKGPVILTIPDEDWVCSSEASDLDDACLSGFRFYLRKMQMDLRVKQGSYDKKAVERIKNPGEYDEVKKTRAEIRGKELEKTEYESPYPCWRLVLKYDVDGDGEEDSIWVVYHRDSKEILQCIYNPLFSQFNPFERIIFYPSEYSIEGIGLCEILYKLQVEIDTLHNQRIDRMTEINAPLVFVRAGIGLDDYKINPGEVTPVDDDLESSIKIVNFPDVYYSTMQEEERILGYARLAAGVAQENQGQTAAERPVFKEAFARLQEANKKFQSGRDNVIRSYERIIKKCIEYFAQYSPEYLYTAKDKDAEGREIFVERTVEFPLEMIWDGLRVELAAATDIMNPDMRREINMTVYHLLSDYMTKSAGMVEAILSPEVPSEFKKWMTVQYEIGVTLIRRIMEDFDQADAEALAVRLSEVIDITAAIQASVDLMPPPPPEGQMSAEGQPTPQGDGNGQPLTPAGPPEGPPPGVPPTPAIQ